MGTFAAFAYVIFEIEISFAKYGKSFADESAMPYSLMDFYSYRRERSKKFLTKHGVWLAFSFYSGFIVFIMYYMVNNEGGAMNAYGWTQDLQCFGVLVIMMLIH
jgi:hypothetical protein